MNSEQIQNAVYEWARDNSSMTAPYGVLTGEHLNKKGKKYRSVTFGRARTLDATVEIYNRNFIVLKTSRHGSMVVKSYDDLKCELEKL
jgi:dTDP-4-dehydrorhamnose 3,5-epimerase-like enzyme